jgi:hypothetical protein
MRLGKPFLVVSLTYQRKEQFIDLTRNSLQDCKIIQAAVKEVDFGLEIIEIEIYFF